MEDIGAPIEPPEPVNYTLPITHIERRFNNLPRNQYINLADIQAENGVKE